MSIIVRQKLPIGTEFLLNIAVVRETALAQALSTHLHIDMDLVHWRYGRRLSPHVERLGESAVTVDVHGAQPAELLLAAVPWFDLRTSFATAHQVEGEAGSQKHDLNQCSRLGARRPAGHLP